MCDYSLESLASRPAKAGDVLVLRKFPTSSTRGFSDEANPDVAVCLLPGAELAFEKPVACRGLIHKLRTGFRNTPNTARFRKLHTNVEYTHHDALELADGTIVMLHELVEGQRARVIQMPAYALPEEEHAHEGQATVRETAAEPVEAL